MSYKVLEVNVDDQGRSGVYSLIVNVIKNKPKDVDIDIAAFENFENTANLNELAQYGTNVKYVGYSGNKLIKQYKIYKNLLRYLKQNKYDCVHIHSDVANKLYIAGKAAKKAGISKIIFHSHASEVDGNYRKIKRQLHKLTRRKLKDIGTRFVACSDVAAKWMYPNINSQDITIINNGIDLDKFRFNSKVRQQVRKKLKLNDNLIIGHIGRFSYQKNHQYIIEIFSKLVLHEPKARLLLVGEGPDREVIENLVKEKNLENNVIFYGLSNHVEKLLQAMDVFILPSHFEGLPIVGVEAQTAGVPVIFSDQISKESKLTNNVTFLPIKANNISQWVTTIEKYKDYSINIRLNAYKMVKNKKFDIDSTIQEFVSLYKNKD